MRNLNTKHKNKEPKFGSSKQKSFISKNLFLIFAILMLLQKPKIIAQCYTNATNSATILSNVAQPYYGDSINTGNDVLGTMHVLVNDDYSGSPLLSWDDGSSPGSIGLSYTDAYDPDVVLVNYSSDIYANVVYWSYSGGGYIFEVFLWGSGSFSNYGSPILLESASTFSTSINIDADGHGHFVIDWDNGSGINMNYGYTPISGPTLLYITPNYRQVINGSSYTMPDVAIYGITAVQYSIYYTYIGGGNTIYVAKASYSSPTTATTVFSSFLGASTTIDYPRIACPPLNTTNDFTVVYRAHDSGNDHIRGFCSITGAYFDYTALANCTYIYPHSYAQANVRPVVSYSSGYNGTIYADGLNVGWTCIFSDIPNVYPFVEPIVVKCDFHGGPISYYLYVPTTTEMNSGADDIENSLSLSGRANSNADIFYTWYHFYSNGGNQWDILYKDVPWTSTALREEKTKIHNQIEGIYPNPNDGNFHINSFSEQGEKISIEVFNSIGQLKYNSNEISESPFFSKELSMRDYPAGIYMVKVNGISHKNSWKVVIMNN